MDRETFIAKLEALPVVSEVEETWDSIFVTFKPGVASLPEEIRIVLWVPLRNDAEEDYVITLQVVQDELDLNLDSEATFILHTAKKQALAEQDLTGAAREFLDNLPSYSEEQLLGSLRSERLP